MKYSRRYRPQKSIMSRPTSSHKRQSPTHRAAGLICYEAGQHFVGLYEAVNDNTLTNILISANRDSRMYNRYIEYLNMLKANGVDMCGNFSFIGAPSKWGSWGVLEYQDQPIEQCAKISRPG